MKYIYTLLMIVLFSTITSYVFAASLQLTKIGNLDTENKNYSQWYYNGTNPILQGMADKNASVDITIDGTASTMYATDDGTWTFTPTTMTDGDHTVAIASNGETISFKLTVGADVPANASTSGKLETLPQTAGGLLPFIAIAGTSILLVGLGFRFGKTT